MIYCAEVKLKVTEHKTRDVDYEDEWGEWKVRWEKYDEVRFITLPIASKSPNPKEVILQILSNMGLYSFDVEVILQNPITEFEYAEKMADFSMLFSWQRWTKE